MVTGVSAKGFPNSPHSLPPVVPHAVGLVMCGAEGLRTMVAKNTHSKDAQKTRYDDRDDDWVIQKNVGENPRDFSTGNLCRGPPEGFLENYSCPTSLIAVCVFSEHPFSFACCLSQDGHLWSTPLGGGGWWVVE